MKEPKLKFNFINLDKDEYCEIFGILILGDYYLFRKNNFFVYKPKTTIEYLYFGLNMKYVNLKKKSMNTIILEITIIIMIFFNENLNGINLNLYNKDRIYKIYENSKYARRAKKE